MTADIVAMIDGALADTTASDLLRSVEVRQETIDRMEGVTRAEVAALEEGIMRLAAGGATAGTAGRRTRRLPR